MHRPMLSLKCLLVSESDSMGCTPQSQQFVVQVHPTASVSCLAQAILNIKLSPLGSLRHPSEIYLWKMRHPIFNGRKLYELRLNKKEGKEKSWPSPQAEMLPPLKAVGCYFGGSSVETEVLVQRAMAPTLSGRLLDRRIDMRSLYTVLSNVLDSELNFDSVEHSSPVELCRSRGALKKNIKLLITQGQHISSQDQDDVDEEVTMDAADMRLSSPTSINDGSFDVDAALRIFARNHCG